LGFEKYQGPLEPWQLAHWEAGMKESKNCLLSQLQILHKPRVSLEKAEKRIDTFEAELSSQEKSLQWRDITFKMIQSRTNANS